MNWLGSGLENNLILVTFCSYRTKIPILTRIPKSCRSNAKEPRVSDPCFILVKTKSDDTALRYFQLSCDSGVYSFWSNRHVISYEYARFTVLIELSCPLNTSFTFIYEEINNIIISQVAVVTMTCLSTRLLDLKLVYS